MRSSSSWTTTFLLAGAAHMMICCQQHNRRAARAFSSGVNAAAACQAAVYGSSHHLQQQQQQQQQRRPRNVPFSMTACITTSKLRHHHRPTMMLGVGGGVGVGGAGLMRNVRGGGAEGIGFGGNRGTGMGSGGGGVPSSSSSSAASSSSSSSLRRPSAVRPRRGSSSSRSYASSVDGAAPPPPPPPPPPSEETTAAAAPPAIDGEDLSKRAKKRARKNAEEETRLHKDYSSMIDGLTPATFTSSSITSDDDDGNDSPPPLTYLSTSSITESGRHRVIFVLGGPGAGKGTQCELLRARYKCVHLSAGELLRKERERNGPHAELIEERISAGQIVPVEISLGLLADAMDEAAAGAGSEDGEGSRRYGSRIFLVDGFPRNFDNLDGWHRIMPSRACVLGTLVFDCPIQELERRILNRGVTSGRSDDNLAAARRRFHTFEEETMPVVRVLERNPTLKLGGVVHIAGDGPLEDVTVETERAMDGFVINDVLTANRALLDAVAEGDWVTYSNLVDPRMLLRSTSDAEEGRGGDDDEISQRRREGGGEEEDEESMKKRMFLDLECTNAAARSAEVEGEGTAAEGRNPGGTREESVVSNANVEVFGTEAVVSYDRSVVVSSASSSASSPPPTGGKGVVLTRVRETRVWRHGATGWVNVHFVRTPMEG